MAKQGNDLRAILEAGEWRSRALLAYIAPEAVDDWELLRSSIEASDDEDEREPENSPAKKGRPPALGDG